MPLNVSDKQRDTEFEQEPQSHHQESLLRSALNSLTNSVFILEVKPNSRTRIIVDCNTAALKAFGYGKNELIGKPINLLHVSNETLVEFERLLYSAAEKNKLPFDLPEFHMKRKDGTILTTEHTVARLLNDKGELTGWVSVIRDISERKKAESALKESEERYHSLFQTMMEGFAYCKMIFDENDRPVDFVYLDVNSAFSRLTGLTNVVGKRVTEVIPRIREKNPELLEIYGRVVLTGHPEQFESDLRSSLGVILDVSVFSQMDEHFVAVFEDITEEKQAQETLRASEEKYRTLVENASDLIFLIDGKSRTVLAANESAARPFGKKPGEIQGKSIFELFPKEIAEEYAEQFNQIIKAGEGQNFESKMVAGGKESWISLSLNPVKDPDGKVSSVLGVARDITERKRLQEELKQNAQHLEGLVAERTSKLHESEERYRLVVENIPYVVWVTRDKKTVYMSRNVSKILGYASEEILADDHRWNITIHPDDLTKVDATLDNLLTRNATYDIEYRVQRKDGEWIWLHERAVSNIETDGARYTYGLFSDITERKKLEDALLTSEQNLRKANESLELGIVETTEQIESIAKLREKLRQTPDLSTALEMVLEKILWEFGMEIGAIFAFDREKGIATLQALKTQSGDMSLEKTYSLNTGFIEFEATPKKNITTLVAEGDNSILKTKNVNSTAIMIAEKEVYGVLTFGGRRTEKLSNIDLVILDFYTELISQTITERRLTVKPVRETPLLKGTSPTRWQFGTTASSLKDLELEVGIIYITKSDISFAYEVFSKFVLTGFQGLCVTREKPSKLRTKLGLEKTPILWLTGESFPNEQTIGSLQDLSIIIGDFLMKAEQPILLMDGFEYLISNNSFEAFLKFLQTVRGRVQNHNAIVIAPLMEKVLEPRELGLIEIETTTLEPQP